MSKNTSLFYEVRVVSNEEKENCLPYFINKNKNKKKFDESRVFKNVTDIHFASKYNQSDNTDDCDYYEYSETDEEDDN